MQSHRRRYAITAVGAFVCSAAALLLLAALSGPVRGLLLVVLVPAAVVFALAGTGGVIALRRDARESGLAPHRG